jgi:hypothetical protein
VEGDDQVEGGGPFSTLHALYTWQHVSAHHMPHLRTSSVVFFYCTSQKVHTADASRPLGGPLIFQETVVTKPRRVKPVTRRKNTILTFPLLLLFLG